ncbi:DNA cytosine methyltransferase [Ruminiclostridium cellobioparum]|uniref:DNA cytosine methyltransferase n=1 Tax=Ruminiclostridium cellobioparum TaxID=29355 RepID=UPI00047F67D3|nr:DNA cytosine methyltransferase [Ruminiclostridium cellobioparum]
MNKKLILDLCGGTGSWSRPYKEAGYDVKVITLPAWDVTKIEFNNYGVEFIRQDVQYRDTICVLFDDVYGILAAPPCTEFSLAKGNAVRNFKEAMKVVEACLQIIWKCRLHTKLQFWAMENPKGFLRQFLGNPYFAFEQWEFGDTGIKPTDIWGYFKPPVKTVSEKPSDPTRRFPNGRINGRGMAVPIVPDEYRGLGLSRAALRAITPKGFAEAFFKANSQEINTNELPRFLT